MATQKKATDKKPAPKPRVDSDETIRKFALDTGVNYEDFSDIVYPDSVGHPTIGFGFNLDEPATVQYLTSKGYNVNALRNKQAKISRPESEKILTELFTNAYDNARTFVSNFDALPEQARYILADMTYNMGPSRLANFKQMKAAFENNNFNEAAKQLKNSKYYNQVGRRSKTHYNTLLDLTAKSEPKLDFVPNFPVLQYTNDGQKWVNYPAQVGPTQGNATYLDAQPSEESVLQPKIDDLGWDGFHYVKKEFLPQRAKPTLWQSAKETVGEWLNDFESNPTTEPTTPIMPIFKQGGDIPYTDTTNKGNSYYEPLTQTITLSDEDRHIPGVYPHEWFHYWQNINGYDRLPEFYPGPLKQPTIPSGDDSAKQYWNRRAVDQEIMTNEFLSNNPSFNFVHPGLVYNKAVNPTMYNRPWTLEGEARQFEQPFQGPTPYPQDYGYKQGGLIKRADGSYSRRGLWDNIRANRGSGRKPTAEMLRQERKIKKKEDGSWVTNSSIPTPTTPPFYPAGKDRTLTNYQMGTDKARMYNAGSTVWTKQDTPLWAAGTPTPTATQNFRNDRSLNTSRYRIGDVIPTGMNYKTPAAGTYDYNKDVQPYYTMRLHAPDTTMMARHGGHIKKHINSPRVYGNPVNPSGMYGDGSTVGYDQAKSQYITASNRGIMGEKQMQDLVKQYPQLANDSSLAGYRSVGNAAMFRNNEEANRVETNTMGQVLSTPASRLKAQREEIVKRRPEVYNVQDYKMGIQEPGAPNDVTSDPISMAILGTAIGGIGLGARGVKTLATDFAGNLASEATFGGYDLTKGTRTLFNSFKPTSSFKSEINWGKWNSEIPTNKALIDEYNTIEQTSKANGSWMKNPDGSTFQGTPEQFIQQNSSNFKKAFPEGFTTGYRGAHQHIDDFANRDLNTHTATFLTDSKANAETYATSDGLSKTYYHPEVDVHPAYDPKLKGYPLNHEDGIYQLAFPKNLPKVVGEGRGNNWRFLDYDENIANNINPEHLKNDHEFRVLNLNSPRKNSSINLTYPNDFTIDKKYLTTDNYATYVKNNPIGIAEIKNVSDQMGNVPGILPNTIYAIDANKVPIKSLMYNNGMFDMTNPNIYKGLVPAGIFGAGMYEAQGMQQQRNGGYVKNNNSNTWLDSYN